MRRAHTGPVLAASLAFRDATLDDVGALVELVQSAYRGDTSREGWTTEADLLDGQRTDAAGVTAVVTTPGSRMLVAEDRDEGLVACCQLELRAAGLAYFGMFAVRPGLQGRGTGRALVAEAERRAVELGATTMRMTVIRQREELIAWYERLGYTRTGERQPFPYGDDRFGRPTRPDLEFEVLARLLISPAPAGTGR